MSEQEDARAYEVEDRGLALVYPMSASSTLLSEAEPMVSEPARRRNGRAAAIAPAPPLRRILEAILFACDRPIRVEQFVEALPELCPEEVAEELDRMAEAYRDSAAGFHLELSGGGYQLRTDPEMHEYVTRFLIGKRRSRLSRAAMETLAIIAYRQPITRGEAEEIRGVDCGQVLHTLLERNLVTIKGRSQALGRPLLYGTTEEFLHYFGINSLADLPSPEELQSLLGNDPLEDPEIRGALEASGLVEDASEEPAPPEAPEATEPTPAGAEEALPSAG